MSIRDSHGSHASSSSSSSHCVWDADLADFLHSACLAQCQVEEHLTPALSSSTSSTSSSSLLCCCFRGWFLDPASTACLTRLCSCCGSFSKKNHNEDDDDKGIRDERNGCCERASMESVSLSEADLDGFCAIAPLICRSRQCGICAECSEAMVSFLKLGFQVEQPRQLLDLDEQVLFVQARLPAWFVRFLGHHRGVLFRSDARQIVDFCDLELHQVVATTATTAVVVDDNRSNCRRSGSENEKMCGETKDVIAKQSLFSSDDDDTNGNGGCCYDDNWIISQPIPSSSQQQQQQQYVVPLPLPIDENDDDGKFSMNPFFWQSPLPPVHQEQQLVVLPKSPHPAPTDNKTSTKATKTVTTTTTATVEEEPSTMRKGWVLIETDYVVVDQQHEVDRSNFVFATEKRPQPRIPEGPPAAPKSLAGVYRSIKKMSLLV